MLLLAVGAGAGREQPFDDVAVRVEHMGLRVDVGAAIRHPDVAQTNGMEGGLLDGDEELRGLFAYSRSTPSAQ